MAFYFFIFFFSNILFSDFYFLLFSPWWPQCFSETRWRTDHSETPLSRRCCCPSCTRWLTAPPRAGAAWRWPRSYLSPPPPSHCPSLPLQQSSDLGLPSRWTSCRRRPSPSCSSQSSAFSPLRKRTTDPPTHWRAKTAMKTIITKDSIVPWMANKRHILLCHWPSFWMMPFLTSQCSSLQVEISLAPGEK